MSNETYTWYSKEISITAFKAGLSFILSKPIKSLIILSCSVNRYDESEINQILTAINIPICGGCYPNVFLENDLLESGVVFIGLPFRASIEVFSHIENNIDDLASYIEKNTTLTNATNAVMFYDGLMANTELFIEELHGAIDHRLTIIGGGAGDLDFIQRPCIYTNDGLQENIIQILVLPQKLSASVGHGWQILEGPFLVSEATGPTIESLNYTSAFSVYQETVEKLSHYRFDEHDFFDISKNFPLGIESIQGELLVRDPIVANEESILCVGNVPINSMVYILKGDKELLIKSAAEAIAEAKKCTNFSHVIIFDCISRKLYLKEQFEKELELLTSNQEQINAFGVLSLGEIANDRGGSIKLLNKSTAIGCF